MKKYQFAQYDNYKATEIQWLENIPKHWKLERVKNRNYTANGATKMGK